MVRCGTCGEENPARARFCLNCGSPIAPVEERRKERKYATALFADLVGSTTLAEREDPEVVQSVVGRAFDRLAEEIQRYEGLLEKFMGDAVLAVFGVPRAHEDDAERAVRAALEMQAILSELNRGFVAEGAPQLAMRIGVEAGEVLVDVQRASGPRDRMLTGDAVNTAARLQTAADPGRVVVGPGVYVATKDVIEYRELPAMDLRGKAEPVAAWEALRIKAKQRGERPSLGMEAGLVGRDEELAVLKQTFRRVETEGRPALVTIVGPAGVGKSRLVHELERYVEGLPQFIYWRRGRCLAYGSVSYSALADAIKAQCEILDDDLAEVATKKADDAVRELFGDEALAPHLRVLVGAGEVRSFSREELFEAWRRFLERLAARYPLVIVLEDIHWADDGLLDFVEHVADWAQGPIMVIALARPELFDQRPAWGGGKRNAASVYLDPLSSEEGMAMLDDLLAGDLPSDLRAAIVERSEGNPLYVEEIVRKLIDDGVLRAADAARWEAARPVDEVDLPRSIQGLIAARLDGLPDDEKAALQDAAVVGRVFWTGAVAELTGKTAEEIRDTLGRLRVKEIVVPNDPPSFSDEHEFAFRHLLIRDGAYDSLPKSLRAQKHGQVARWAERRAGDRAEDIAELIATHDVEAVRYLEELGASDADRGALERHAFRWARAAGDRAFALWVGLEAVRWYAEALRLAEAIDVPVEERAVVARAYAQACFLSAAADEAERAFHTAIELFEATGDDLGVGWAHSKLCMLMLIQGRDDEAFLLGEAALARLEPHGETEELADALNMVGWYHWRRGHNEQAELLLRRSIEVAEHVGAPVVRASAFQNLAVTIGQDGRTEEALEAVEVAFRLAKEVGDASNLLRMYNNLASVLADFASDYRRARDVLIEGLDLARKAGAFGFRAWMTGSLGDVEAELGNLVEAERLARESISLAQAAADEPLLGMRYGALAWALLLEGKLDEAIQAEDRADEILRSNPEPQAEVLNAATNGYLALAKGDDDQAIVQLRRSVQIMRDFNVELIPGAFAEMVRVHLRRGEREPAVAYRDLSERTRSPRGRANAGLIDGLLAEDAVEAVQALNEAAERFEQIGNPIGRARALIDMGRAQRRAGDDPRPTFELARDVLKECGAGLYLIEAETELEREPPG